MVFLKRLLPTAITMLVAFVTLVLYFLPSWMVGEGEAILYLRAYWIEMAVVIAAFAMLLGIFNLSSVHLGRIRQRRRGWFFSLMTILVFWVVLAFSVADIVGLTGPIDANQELWGRVAKGASGPAMTWIYQYWVYPLQSTFTALLAFLLAFAAYRTLRLRRGVDAWLFVLATLAMLFTFAVPAMPEFLMVRDWLVNVWATAGLRGVLLGIALGTLATAIRVLLGFDRPASE